ncbi:histone-lysine N-methyltransferase MECOM-like [Callorhinchus milii]|uniref:histone-lysine N-methyltransferase MECOM-like n=1 Tax=Callorhinchus milii TaxID=7868 RepID=UPI00045716A8|nr:histone-lysine N-methyltransferase MECOM-like [Callorhinchus milii]|eukprot:gi/632939233/ref/XP_007909246.1/ PREDICTED: zinc finger protein 845-like [Callorhinchus milii]
MSLLQIKVNRSEEIVPKGKSHENSSSDLEVSIEMDFLKGEEPKIAAGDRKRSSFSPLPPKCLRQGQLLACRFCSVVFKSPKRHQEHEYRHALMMLPVDVDDIKATLTNTNRCSLFRQTLRYRCSWCSASFTLKSNAERHEKTVHYKCKNLHCSFCAKSFRDRTDLNRHVASVHSCERAFMCGNCGKNFGIQKNLLNHMKVCYQSNLTQVGFELSDHLADGDALKGNGQFETHDDASVIGSDRELSILQHSDIELSDV